MSGHPILPAEPITLPLLPLRDVVVFPHMVIPLFVGRPKSIKALEAAMEAGRQIMLVAQKAAGKDEPKPDDMFEVGCVSSILQMLKLPDGTVKVLVEGIAARQHAVASATAASTSSPRCCRCRPRPRPQPEVEALRRAVTQQFDQYVKLNKKIPPEILTSIAGIDDAGPPGRHDRRAPAAQARGQAVGARPVRGRQAAREAARAARARGRHPAGRKAHPRPRQAPDGEEPARVLPQRAGQGDPEGARRRRGGRRPRGAREEDQGRAHAQGGAQEGRRRAEEAQADVADVGRGDGGAQLHRHAGQPAVEQEDQDQARPRPRRAGPERGPLRPREGQGPHPRIPRRAAARRQGQGADPVPRRASGRRQDLARPVGGARHRAQVRAHGARRRARRGRDPRPPPHLHRLDAGQGAAEPVEDRHAKSRCSCSTRSTSSAWTSAAIRRRRCSRCSTRSRTTPSATTTSRSISTSRT